MISVSIHDIIAAEAVLEEGLPWVTLRTESGDRVVLHLHTYDQCVAIANAINAEAEARPAFDPLPLVTGRVPS